MPENKEDLAHYGVPGMKWGKRKAYTPELKAKDKASKAADREKQAKSVDAARKKVKSGDLQTRTSAAKAKYKEDKYTIGKAEAKKALRKVYDQNAKTIDKANEYKNGKEVAGAVLLAVGAVEVSAIIKSRQL